MNVWKFLKRNMRAYGDRVAFTKGRITYADLIGLAESPSGVGKSRPIVAKGDTRQGQAIEILRILAGGNIPVPVESRYGAERERQIREILAQSVDSLRRTAFVLFTSGTTGQPKGVKLGHRGLIENIKGIDGYFRVRTGDKILIARPPVHVAVLVGELLFGLYKGLEIDFYEEDFQPARLACYLEERDIRVFCCTPTLMYHLSARLKPEPPRTVAISGERLNEGVIERLKEKLPRFRFYNVYGLTENSPRVSALCPDRFFEKPGSVGKPIAHTRVRLKRGELLVRSRSVMLGYLGEKDKTRQKIRRGWLYTGDMARRDGEGFLYILGRKDDMIIRSGMNIYPAEIESAALRTEGVKGCLVYGEEDVRFGQRICMKAVADIGAAEIRKGLAERLPAYLMPDRISVVERLELTAGGKVKRK